MTHLNHLKNVMGAATVALAFAFAPSAFAQQQGGMPGMDMQMMMNHCAQVRQQVQQTQVPAMAHPAEVQQELARCDQMDLMNSQMNSQPGMNPAQQAPWPQH